jgi:phosphoserine aminotransferase
MNRPYNFSPGPAMLPEVVLRQAAEELLSWQGSGMSVMEMSHRGPHYTSIHARAVADLRRLLEVPDDYAVLLMQGGALAHNAIVPLNLSRGGKVDFVLTGSWSEKSAREAARYCDAAVVADARARGGRFDHVPPFESWRLRPQSAYLHLCTNETVHGVEMHDLPPLPADLPVVADASSHILSQRIDVRRYGCLFGGAQKNIGIAGLTFVIVRRALLGHALPACPSAFDYAAVDAADSMFNTPPAYAIYIAGLVFRWIEAFEYGGRRGLDAIEAHNADKARLMYDCIDASALYRNGVDPGDRSRMNVTFTLAEPRLEASFVEQAAAAGLINLKGHKSVGGMRASIYNAMPIQAVRLLVDFMRDFERRCG